MVAVFCEVKSSVWLEVVQKSGARAYNCVRVVFRLLHGPGILVAVVTSWNISTPERCYERFVEVMWKAAWLET